MNMSRHEYLEVDDTSRPPSLFSLVGDSTGNDTFDIGLPPLMQVSPSFTGITPKPGLCVKAKTDSNEKLFINVCHCSDVPPPPPSFDVMKIVTGAANNEESLFRFPLSLGEPHMELDLSGKGCECYDVVINSDFFEQVKKNSNIRDFITTLAVSGLERKYNISIDVGTCTVLNKPYHGKPPVHYIKLMPTQKDQVSANKAVPMEEDVVMPVKNPSRFAEPAPEISSYEVYQSPAIKPKFIVFQGLVKGMKNKNDLCIDLHPRCIMLSHKNGKFLRTLYLYDDVIPEKSMVNFWKNRLFVVMPLRSST